MMMGMLAVVMSDNVAGTMMVRFLDLKKELSSFQGRPRSRTGSSMTSSRLTQEEDLMSIVLIVNHSHIGSHVQNYL